MTVHSSAWMVEMENLLVSLWHLKPVFYKDMKREGTGDNAMSGFTADKRIIHLTEENFDIESQFNRISDGFTVEEKNAKAYVIASKNVCL